jgi:hypothetical protein
MPRRGVSPAVWWWGLVLLIVAVGAGASWRLLGRGTATSGKPLAAKDATPTPPVKSLPEEDRKAIWDIEHQGLVLKKYGFSSLKSALRDGDRAALLKLLAADFEGQALSQPREIRLTSGYVDALRQEEAVGQPRRPLTGAEFVERLLEYRHRFAAAPELDLDLMTLSPEAPDNVDGAWKGEVQLRMWGGKGNEKEGSVEVLLNLQFRLANPQEETLSGGGWLHGCAIRQTLASEASRFLLKDVTAQRGIDAGLFYDNWTRGSKPLQTITGGVYLTDFDRDGCLDMLIVDLNRIVLYKGLPDGRFVDVTAKVGLPLKPDPYGVTAAVVDLDGDGWEDLIVGRHIYTNVSDGKGGRRFEDSTVMTNLQISPDATAIIPIDFDRDGHMDLYVTRVGTLKASSWVDGTGAGGGCRLWRNTGKGLIFEEVTAKSGAGAGQRSVFSAVCLDADNDGWPDLYVINEFGDGVLLLNNHDGTFREEHLTKGLGDFGSMGVTCGDIDNDGNIDLYVASMYSKAGSRIINNVRPDAYSPELMAQMRRFVTGSQLYLNRGKAGFETKGQDYKVAAVGWAYGAALVDLDNDGWLDLFATCGFVSQDRSTPDG